MTGKPLIVGLAAGLTIALCTDAGLAVLSDSLSFDFIAGLNIGHIILSLVGGFFVGGMIAGLVEKKDDKIKFGSRYSYLLIALGTGITYMLLGKYFF
jgi:hypothetical protein